MRSHYRVGFLLAKIVLILNREKKPKSTINKIRTHAVKMDPEANKKWMWVITNFWRERCNLFFLWGVLGKLMCANTAMGEMFYKRHCHHHASTGEKEDPKMRRYLSYCNTRWERFGVFVFPLMALVDKYWQAQAAKKFKKKIKINETVLKLESGNFLFSIYLVFF